jgi:TctA family transporter
MVLVERPISGVMLALAAIALFIVVSPAIRKKRDEALKE